MLGFLLGSGDRKSHKEAAPKPYSSRPGGRAASVLPKGELSPGCSVMELYPGAFLFLDLRHTCYIAEAGLAFVALLPQHLEKLRLQMSVTMLS